MLPDCGNPDCENFNASDGTCQPCDNPVNVVIMWHMHQPQYGDLLSHSFFLPWTYLHAIKDYWDMAVVIEESPGAKVVVNFSAALLAQIDEYCNQFDGYFEDKISFGDELLNTLARPILTTSSQHRRKLLQQCLRANDKNLIQRFKPFALLAETATEALENEQKMAYLNDQFYFDLLVWYHLAWMGETVRLHNPDCQHLMALEFGYTHSDRQLLLQLMSELLHGIIPRYHRLWQQQQVELTVTPENHPILPLLVDFATARESIADAPLPSENYPGGTERALAHIDRGLQIFADHFGHKPSGCWPGEGAVCDETLAMLAQHGIHWTATGAGVLYNTLKNSQQQKQCIHHAYTFGQQSPVCFFRDDNLSDLIGFTFHDWNPDDAVNHLIHHIENIQLACQSREDTVVAIILDGENCWEYYPNNGYYFLRTLYNRFSSHHRIRLTTFHDYLQQHYVPTHLKSITAGSWVFGNLATWVGDPDKNRGWQLLVEAKKAYDQVIDSLPPQQQALAEDQLSVCESSDWFWWFGDYNAQSSVSDFDRLYRRHLSNLYQLLGLTPPANLQQVISVGHGNPENDGTMRRGSG